jgi:hypothetical protein
MHALAAAVPAATTAAAACGS